VRTYWARSHTHLRDVGGDGVRKQTDTAADHKVLVTEWRVRRTEVGFCDDAFESPEIIVCTNL
jgi:hypothetical protein